MARVEKNTSPDQSEFQAMMRLGLAFLLVTIFSSIGFFSRPAVAESKKDLNVVIGEKDTSAVEQNFSQSKEALVPAQKPIVPSAPVNRSPFGGNRQPAITPIELDIVRTQDGKLQIRSVNPQSKFSSRVKQSQVFSSWEEIWDAIGERPDIDPAAELVEDVQTPAAADAHSK